MKLTNIEWSRSYSPDRCDLVDEFYIPALKCAVRYDRTTGYFSASAFSLAMRGIEGLVKNRGRMRLVVGCTLNEKEVDAISRGEQLRAIVEKQLTEAPIEVPDAAASNALELLAWMIQHSILDVKIAIPCDAHRRPIPSNESIFHEKSGAIEDSHGNTLVFSGSINETEAGWRRNWEQFNVYRSWDHSAEYATETIQRHSKIWNDEAPNLIVVDIPTAVRDRLLQFTNGDLPARLADMEFENNEAEISDLQNDSGTFESSDYTDKRSEVRVIDSKLNAIWRHIRESPKVPETGVTVGIQTSAVEPWPHQLRTFMRLHAMERPRLLIADEVGLGKTIQAGMLLRQLWLEGRANRVLVLSPASLTTQWQLELREKFNLDWPIYNGDKLSWTPSPSRSGGSERKVGSKDWHKERTVIASSHLMRRKERERELCEDAEPWDLIVLDEAHHARRKSAGSGEGKGPNELLRLMTRLKDRTKGLLLLTATPMQVDPVEAWDLLNLLGLPREWSESTFRSYFELSAKPKLSNDEFETIARAFRSTEERFGETSDEQLELYGIKKGPSARRILRALRGNIEGRRRELQGADRIAAIKLMRSVTPVSQLVSRNTRTLLRKYLKEGLISVPIADRVVEDRFIVLSNEERDVYEAVERYISSTYNNAAPNRKNAVGFVMTIYRRRLASSFAALRATMESRLKQMNDRPAQLNVADDISEDEGDFDAPSLDDANALSEQALKEEEKSEIQELLAKVKSLSPDTKVKSLENELDRLLRNSAHSKVMIFTQFTDTMDFIRKRLSMLEYGRLLCYSGRGGEILDSTGAWKRVDRETLKAEFRKDERSLLICTDAAAEGLNFQFCGALVNYDMPWNPMRVEQRIGRIDRLGQKYSEVRIVNMHYKDTVESDVYDALRKRIKLFESVVGKLQPILSTLSDRIAQALLGGAHGTSISKEQLTEEIVAEIRRVERSKTALDINELNDATRMPTLKKSDVSLKYLDDILNTPDLLPAGYSVRKLGDRQYALSKGSSDDKRVTTSSKFFEEHSSSVELWSPGSPLFPIQDW